MRFHVWPNGRLASRQRLSDIGLFEDSKELDPIRNTDRFREIMAKARKTGQTEKRSGH